MKKKKEKTKEKENEKELKNEKEYLEREHKSDKEIKVERVKEPLKENEIEEQKEQIEQEEVKKKMIEIKPRETYLKDKIVKMKFNNNVLSGINKGIDEQLSYVRKDIISRKVELTENPKNVEKYVNKSFDNSLNNKNLKDNFNLKSKFITVKDLKMEKDILNRKLMQIVENEDLLCNKENSNLVVEKNLKEKIKKDVEEQKKKLTEKINNINEKIKNIILDEDDINSKKQDNLKNFIDNFERDKEIIEIRAQKYLKEKKERNKRIANDLNQLAEKRKKELEDKDKKEKENHKKLQTKLKRQAKQIENKHSKEVGAKALLYKPYINETIEGTAKKYLFMQNYEKFLKNEKNLIDQENLNRKNRMKQVSNEELEEFNNKMDKKREEKKLITEKKTEKLYEEWNERKKAIPSYVSPFLENAYSDITNPAKDEIETKEKRVELIDKLKGYAEEIRYLKQPKIDKDLEKKRLNSINNLDPKRFLLEKDTLQHNKRKGRIILKKPDPSKPSKFKWDLKINNSENEISIEKKLIKKPKQYRMSMSMDKSAKNKLPSIQKDYLSEIKEMNSKVNSSSNLIKEEENYVKSSAKKWDKIVNDKNMSYIENINLAKDKVDILESKAVETEKLLRAQEPNSNNIELNKKVTNLYIDSINAKLSLLNKMS